MGEGVADLDFAGRVELHRHELQVHCYRMLGSFTDAEDLVQETLLRAWRHRDDLREGDNVRAWLYKIATNACLDHIKAHRRRITVAVLIPGHPVAGALPGPIAGPVRTRGRGTPGPGHRAGNHRADLPGGDSTAPGPATAAIILRDVLEWPVPEIAALLDLSTAAVNSALQRGRATLRSQLPRSERETWAAEASSQAEREVLDAYIAAYQNGDDDATLALLRDDIRVTMPPAPYLFEGLAAIRQLVERARDTGTWRLLPTWANRQPAAACYLLDPASGEFRAFKLDVLGLAEGKIAEITAFGPRHFPAFDLVAVLP